MADTTPDYFRGFLVPMEITKDNIWTAQSSFSQADNISGSPEPQQAGTSLVLKTGGEQNTGSDINIITRAPGHVGRGAGFTWKNNATSSGEFGQDAPNAISKFEFIGYSDGTALTDKYQYPYPFDIGNGEILVAIRVNPGSVASRQIKVYKRTLAGVWSNVLIKTYASEAILNSISSPILIRKPDGKILLLFLEEDTTQEVVNLCTWRSDDEGASFTEISRAAFRSPISIASSTGYTIRKIRGAALGGQVLLFVETVYNGTPSTGKKNQLFQFCSIDGGVTFKQATPANKLDESSFYEIDCFTRHGQFILTYIGATNEAHYMPISQGFHYAQLLRSASQYTTISTDTIAGGTSDHMTSGQSTAWTDDDDNIYVLFEDSTGQNLFMRTSEDGKSWNYMNGDNNAASAIVYNIRQNTTVPARIKGISAFGRGLLASNWDLVSNYDKSATLLHLGGYSNVNLPKAATGLTVSPYNRAGFSFSYVPLELPASISAFTLTGAGTETLTTEGMKLSTSAIQTRAIAETMHGAITSGGTIKFTVKIALKTNDKGAISAPFTNGKRELKFEIGDNVTSYIVGIFISPTQYQVYDYNAAANVGSPQSIAGADGVVFLVGLDNSRLNVWHHQMTDSDNEDWILGVTTSTLSDGGSGPGGLAKMTLSHTIAPPALSTLDTTIVYWLAGDGSTTSSGKFYGMAGEGLGTFSNPGDLLPALYSPIGKYKYVVDGLSISTGQGVGYENDQYNIKTRYGYSINNAFYSVAPTPRIFWRSTSVTSGNVPENMIAIAYDSASQAANENPGNNTIGIHLNNINFRNFNLEYYSTGAGSWQVLKAVDVSQGLTFNYQKHNATIMGIDGGTDEPYIYFNEAAGWIAELTHSGSGTVERFNIVSNTAGKCGSISYKRPVFKLDGVPGSNGVCRLIPREITLISNLGNIEMTAVAIRITAQETVDKYFQIGQILIGTILTGYSYSWGRTISIEHNIEATTTPDKVTYTREMAKPNRAVSVAWTEGVDITQVSGENPTPDVFTASTTAGSLPIATPQDMPLAIVGLFDYLKGGVNPVVYLPSIQRATTTAMDNILLNRYHEHVFCRLENDEVSIENVLGDELQTEVFRISNLNFIEII